MKIFSKPNASFVSIYVEWKDKTEKLWTSIERKRIFIYRRQIEADCHLSLDIHLAPLFCHPSGGTDWSALSFLRMLCCHRHWPILKSPSFHIFPSQKECWLSSNTFIQKKKCIHRRETKLDSGWVSFLSQAPPPDSFLSWWKEHLA